MKKFILLLSVICCLFFVWFIISEIYTAEAQKIDKISFEIKQGESVGELAIRLEDEQVIRNAWIFKKYLVFKGLDKKINYGEFEVESPITTARVATALSQPGLSEREITIIPGWNLRQVAEYFVKEGLAENVNQVYDYVGEPARVDSWESLIFIEDKNNIYNPDEVSGFANDFETRPNKVSFEGYLSPNTYRIYKNASLRDILVKLIVARNDELNQFYPEPLNSYGMTVHDILILASIVEKEANTEEDMAIVADIFLRRLAENWALQSCATVNYVTGKNDPGISLEDKENKSTYNTYKYAGLPPGPICNPSLGAIKAVLYPKRNNYNYFLTGSDGVMRYAEDLEGHNLNRTKYLL